MFIDARQMGDDGKNDDGYVNLSEDDKTKITNTLFNWQSPEWKELYSDEPEFCYSASKEEIRNKNYTLIPSKYIEFIDHDLDIDYEKEMNNIVKSLTKIIEEEDDNQKELINSLKGIGYDVR